MTTSPPSPLSTLLPLLPLLTPLLPSLSSPRPRPLFLALTGLQGSGKSTLAAALVAHCRSLGLRAAALSLDDFYLPRPALAQLRDAGNPLWRGRGQPGTHDPALAARVLAELRALGPGTDGRTVRVPRFDKGRFGGEGDRVEAAGWAVVEGPLDVVVFEGWCVGFAPLGEGEVRARWGAARAGREARGQRGRPTDTLADHGVGELLAVDQALRGYCATFMGPERFDVLVHLDTERLENVYGWRIEQEQALRAAMGEGMTEGEVVEFVRRYMPAYELYLDGLRAGFFKGKEGAVQIRLVLGEDRSVVKIEQV